MFEQGERGASHGWFFLETQQQEVMQCLRYAVGQGRIVVLHDVEQRRHGSHVEVRGLACQ